jgi:hypothetical protein
MATTTCYIGLKLPPDSTYDNKDIEEHFSRLQYLLIEVPKDHMIVIRGDVNARVGIKSTNTRNCNKTLWKFRQPERNDNVMRKINMVRVNALCIPITMLKYKKYSTHTNNLDRLFFHHRIKKEVCNRC